MQGLETIDFFEQDGLLDKENNKQREYDGQLQLRDNREGVDFSTRNGLTGIVDKESGNVLVDREQGKQN